MRAIILIFIITLIGCVTTDQSKTRSENIKVWYEDKNEKATKFMLVESEEQRKKANMTRIANGLKEYTRDEWEEAKY